MTKLTFDTRREFLKVGLTAFAGLGLLSRASGQHAHGGDHPAVHGMVVVGTETLYLSHLPLFKTPTFDSPHDYQVILEAKLPSKQGALFAKDQADTGSKLYTLEPEKFVLPSLTGPLHNFHGSVYRGHFERDGTPILKRALIDVTRVVHFRKFTPEAPAPERLRYLLFGKGGILFLAHYISRPPDFDQLLAVGTTELALTDEQLAKGLIVEIPKRSNAVADRLREGDRVAVDCLDERGKSLASGELAVGAEFYFEKDELAG